MTVKTRPNRSRSLLLLLSELTKQPELWRHGYDLSRATQLFSGTLYPLLMRLERDGYLESRWEEPVSAGRPRRHGYRLTRDGIELANHLAADAPTAKRMANLVQQPT